ncbi:FAD-dependent oxidoreductase [Prochlorococcus sp. MIT 1341]|uniref:FAD-dependent oxidoreductase n=1 Tax=Prochlorococcus sp. MIT 1341 TaxID=3096221 RepID=UPI002A74E10F|nr:FAD-dependent oxidoreductase [Prochlorococcus sp. MIT 1341]
MTYKVCIIGGGFYGCSIALYLRKFLGLKDVSIYEKESDLLLRASYVNQARVHNGYHYPRSFTTAYRSHINFQRFTNDWPSGIKSDFSKYYAIARRNSKVNSKQYERFYQKIGAPIEQAKDNILGLFNRKLIQNIYKVQEYAFDVNEIRKSIYKQINDLNVKLYLNHRILKVFNSESEGIRLHAITSKGQSVVNHTNIVINCTYSGINKVMENNCNSNTELKHEIVEMALLDVPLEISDLGITIMDGPFFSVMPFPAHNCHSIYHVRYSPHLHWDERSEICPYKVLSSYSKETRIDRILRDASRYIPCLSKCNYVSSIFDVRTVLKQNEMDDGRPILVREEAQIPGMYSIIGGKLDNIYDALEKISSILKLKHNIC